MNELQITELNGQRVLTTQQIADGYGTKKRTIVDNFGNNKSRFKEGKHFFLLDGEELKKFKDNNENFGVVGNRAPKLYLWTEKGALLHAKSLGTDEAWDMYDILVDTYFKVQEEKQLPQTPEQQIALLAQGNVNLNKKVEQIENSVLDLTDRFGLPSNKAKVLQKKVASKVYMFTGGKYSNAHKKLGAKVFREFYKDLNNRFDVVKYSDIPLSRYDEATEYLDMWQPSFNTTLEIRGLNSQTSFDFEAQKGKHMGDKRSPTKTVTSWPNVTFWSEGKTNSMNKEEFEEFKSRTVWPNGVGEMRVRDAYNTVMERLKS